MIKKITLLVTLTVFCLSGGAALANEQDKKSAAKTSQSKEKKKKHSKDAEKKMSEKDIKKEISYYAKKLLDMSGEDQITLTQDPYAKPFLGVCSEVTENGVKLTCITPGHNAGAAGLQTGDYVTELNGINLVSENVRKVKRDYYGVLMNMKTGDVLDMKILRAGEVMTYKPTVGQFHHPGYTIKVYRTKP